MKSLNSDCPFFECSSGRWPSDKERVIPAPGIMLGCRQRLSLRRLRGAPTAEAAAKGNALVRPEPGPVATARQTVLKMAKPGEFVSSDIVQ